MTVWVHLVDEQDEVEDIEYYHLGLILANWNLLQYTYFDKTNVGTNFPISMNNTDVLYTVGYSCVKKPPGHNVAVHIRHQRKMFKFADKWIMFHLLA